MGKFLEKWNSPTFEFEKFYGRMGQYFMNFEIYYITKILSKIQNCHIYTFKGGEN